VQRMTTRVGYAWHALGEKKSRECSLKLNTATCSAAVLFFVFVGIAAGGSANGAVATAATLPALRWGGIVLPSLRLRGGVDPEIGDFAGDISYESEYRFYFVVRVSCYL